MPPPGKKARPAFNPLLLSSAFYAGPTTYGGAGAISSRTPPPPSTRRTPQGSPSSSTSSLSLSIHNTDHSIRPSHSGPPPPISRTAKRILDLLEEYSSPISDAKRVPRPVNPPLALAVRPKPYSCSSSSSSLLEQRASSAPSPSTDRFRSLRLPSSATLLKLRSPRPTHSAIAASLSSCRPPSPPRSSRSESGYSLPVPDSRGYRGKVRRGADLTEEFSKDDAPRLPDVRLQIGGKDIVIESFVHPTPRDSPPRPSKKFRFRDPLDLPTYRETVSAAKPVECWNGDRPSTLNGDVTGGKTASADVTPTNGPTPNFATIVAQQAKLWECDSCMTRNAKDKDSCVCCEAPKPRASPVKKDSTLADIVKKQSQLWNCPDCFTGNEQTKESCVCCSAAKPGKKPEVPAANSSLSSILEKQKKMWECSDCLTRNDPNRAKCVCCEGSRPGAESSAPAAALGFNFGTTNQSFKFGIDKADAPAGPTKNNVEVKPNFSFGIGTKEESSALPGGGFKFGASTKSPEDVSKPTFKFGEKLEGKEVSAAPVKFNFGNPLNVESPKVEAGKSVEKSSEPSKPTFSFGSPVKVTTPSVSGTIGSVAASVSEPDSAVSSAATPAKPSFGAFSSASTSAPTAVSPSVAITSTSTVPSQLFSFGNTSTPAKPLQFGSPSTIASSPSTPWSSGTPQNVSKPLFESKPLNFGSPVSDPPKSSSETTNSTVKLPSFGESLAPKLPSFSEATASKLASFGDTNKMPLFGDSSKTSSFGDANKAAVFGDANKAPAYENAIKTPAFGNSNKTPIFGDPNKSSNLESASKTPTFGNTMGNANKTTAFGDTSKVSTFPGSTLFTNLPESKSQISTDSSNASVTTVTPGMFQFGEKPKESSNFSAPVFSFMAQPSATNAVSSTSSNIFSETSSAPLFSFGAKTEPSSVPSFNSPSNIFSSKPLNTETPAKPSSNLFSNAPSGNLFSSPAASLFNSTANPSPSQPPTNLFGTNNAKAPIFGSPVAINSSQPTNAPQFGNSSFGNNLIFGQQNTQPGATATPTNALQEKHLGESNNNLFNMNHTSQPSSNNIFGNLPATGSTITSNNNAPVFGASPAVPTPSFGSSLPFGNPQIQSNTSTPFKFGATNINQPSVNPGFGATPAAATTAPVFTFGGGPAPPSNSQFNFNMGAPSAAFSTTPNQSAYPQRRMKKAVRRTVMR